MARPIEHDNGKRAKLRLAYDKGGRAEVLREANKLQVTSTQARALAQEWEAESASARQE